MCGLPAIAPASGPTPPPASTATCSTSSPWRAICRPSNRPSPKRAASSTCQPKRRARTQRRPGAMQRAQRNGCLPWGDPSQVHWLQAICSIAASLLTATSRRCAFMPAATIARRPLRLRRQGRRCWRLSPISPDVSPACIAPGSTHPAAPRRTWRARAALSATSSGMVSASARRLASCWPARDWRRCCHSGPSCRICRWWRHCPRPISVRSSCHEGLQRLYVARDRDAAGRWAFERLAKCARESNVVVLPLDPVAR